MVSVVVMMAGHNVGAPQRRHGRADTLRPKSGGHAERRTRPHSVAVT